MQLLDRGWLNTMIAFLASGAVSDLYRFPVRRLYPRDKFFPANLEMPWLLIPGIAFGLALAFVLFDLTKWRAWIVALLIVAVWFLAFMLAAAGFNNTALVYLAAAFGAAGCFCVVGLLSIQGKADVIARSFILAPLGTAILYVSQALIPEASYTIWQCSIGTAIVLMVRSLAKDEASEL